MRKLVIVGLLVIAGLLLLVGGSSSAAAVKRCGSLQAHGSFADHIRAKALGCKRARRITRRYVRRCAFDSPTCSISGYSCKTTSQTEELRHARCVKGSRVIRFHWGS